MDGISGVSTIDSRAVRSRREPARVGRAVDDLVQAMGLSGISKSTVSKLCKDIDDYVGAFLDHPLGRD